jgi:hypothetical protein
MIGEYASARDIWILKGLTKRDHCEDGRKFSELKRFEAHRMIHALLKDWRKKQDLANLNYWSSVKFVENKSIDGYRDCGTANGWKEKPSIVEKCNHPKREKTIGRCLTEYTCDICKIRYEVDSSD